MELIDNVVEMPPPKSEPKYYAIRTGLRLTNEMTGSTLELYVCSRYGTRSWLLAERKKSVYCEHCDEKHKTRSLSEALQGNIVNFTGQERAAALLPLCDLLERRV